MSNQPANRRTTAVYNKLHYNIRGQLCDVRASNINEEWSGELGAKWSDLDLEARTVTVTRTLVWRKGVGWCFGEPKTARSRRTITFPDPLAKLLRTHKAKQSEFRLKLGGAYCSENLVFASIEGTPLNIRNLTQRHFKQILKRANLPRVSACTTFGTHARLYYLLRMNIRRL